MSMTPKLEVPDAMREFADQSVSQAKQAFDTFISNAQSAVVKMEDTANSAQATGAGMQKDIMAFAESQVTGAFDLAQKMVRAKDAQELVELQATYMREQMEAISKQSKDMGEKMSSAAQDAANAMKP
ncbi:MAG: phasin family protein [Pseudomonadota bacterium]